MEHKAVIACRIRRYLWGRRPFWHCQTMQPQPKVLQTSISTTTTNGKRLLEDAKLLFDWDRFSTALALAVLAQEEFAKAFLLQLVADGALPWMREVQRSMARHECKHLLGLVMEWLPPWDAPDLAEQPKRRREWHEQKMAWLQRSIARYKEGNFAPNPNDPEPVEPDVSFPTDVATALNIYRHEKIESLGRGVPWMDADWSTGQARKIADGSLDRKKQSALYVHITRTGEVGLHPGLVTREQAVEAIERAERLQDTPVTFSDEYLALKEVLPALFANVTTDD
jgi:AbiV family abortive infection protein